MKTLDPHKRGDSFTLFDCQLLDDNDTPENLTNIAIKCQLRTIRDTLISDMQIVKHSGNLYYDIIAPSTDSWPLGSARFDIEYTDQSGRVFSTETIALPVIQDETR